MKRVEFIGPAIVVSVAALFALLAVPMAYRSFRAARTEAEVREASRQLSESPVLAQMSQASRDVARVVEPSVVHVSTGGMAHGRGGARSVSSSGSGWVWDEDGHIVTNAHVVDGANTIEVQLYDGERRDATLVGMELRADVAVLKIDADGVIPAHRSNEEPRQGDLVFAFGSPFDFRFSMSTGIISGVGRTAGLADLDYENFIQVDAAINPGNSGGPLTDILGRVIGMNTAIATGRGGSLGQGQSAGIGLAIPMEMIESIVTQIIKSGRAERSYLGVSAMGITELRQVQRGDANPFIDHALRTFQGDGAIITSVGIGSPAAQADLRPGDVILSIAGVKTAARKQVFAVVGTQRPGSKVRVDFWRPEPETQSGARQSVEVVLIQSDPELSYGFYAAALRSAGLLTLSTATPQRCAERGVPFRRGVLIEALAPGSLAGNTLAAGTIITEVEGQRIGTLDELYTRMVRALDGGMLRSPQVSLSVMSPEGEAGVMAVPISVR